MSMSDDTRGGWGADAARLMEEMASDDVFAQVRAFWEIGHPDKLADRPQMPSRDNLQLCLRLICEEREELLVAVRDKNLAEMADALGDLIYVTIGMGLACGFPMREVFARIQRSNMAKFPGGVVTRRPKDGKVMKPDGWQPPDIAGALRDATEIGARCIAGRTAVADVSGGWRCIHPEGHGGPHIDEDGKLYG